MDNNYVSLEQLEPLFSETGYYFLGHGTGRRGNSMEVVESIFNTGLRTKDNSLYYTTIGLNVPTPELKDNYRELGLPEPTMDDLKNSFNNWAHADSKKIIIARIPLEYVNELADKSDLDGERYGAFYTKHVQEDGKEVNYLDSKFIVGCFDVDKQAVLLNKNFEKTLSDETKEKLSSKHSELVELVRARYNDNSSIVQEHDRELQDMFDDVQPSFDDANSFGDDIDWDFPVTR